MDRSFVTRCRHVPGVSARALVGIAFLVLVVLTCAAASNADCPNPKPLQPQPIPSPWVQRNVSLSAAPTLPVHVGSETSAATYTPKYAGGFSYAVSVTVGSTLFPTYDQCASHTIQYTRKYGNDPNTRLIGALSDTLNVQAQSSITESLFYGLTLFGQSGETPAQRFAFQAGTQYVHGPCCGITNPGVNPASWYHAVYVQGDLFAGRVIPSQKHGFFDVTIEYSAGTQKSPLTTSPSSVGSAAYLSFQPEVSFDIFGEGSDWSGKIGYTHSQSQYLASSTTYFANDYSVAINKILRVRALTPGLPNAWGTAGLSFSKFTPNDSTKFFLPPFSTRSTLATLSLKLNAWPWVLSPVKPSRVFGTPPAGQPALGGTRLPLHLVTDDRKSSIRAIMPVTINGTPLHLLFDTGSPGVRVFASSLTGTAITDTGHPETITFGTTGAVRRYVGTLGRADVSFGTNGAGAPLHVANAAVEIVKSVCPDAGPGESTCTTRAMADEAAMLHADGIFGSSPVRHDGEAIYSVFSQLPSPEGDSFVVSMDDVDDGYVQLGVVSAATAPKDLGFSVVPVDTPRLQKLSSDDGPRDRADGGFAWSTDKLHWCYTIGAPPVTACADDVFTDSGGLQAHLALPAAQRLLPALPNDQLTTLPAGIPMRASASANDKSAPMELWSFTTGNCLFNTVNVYEVTGKPPEHFRASNGINPYFGNQVLYDVKDGLFGMRPASASPQFC
jgi:hypothetical protein